MSWIKNLFLIFSTTIIGFILCELFLQFLLGFQPPIYKLMNHVNHYASQFYTDELWEKTYLARYDSGTTSTTLLSGHNGLHAPHATRGWTNKPNMRVEIGGVVFSTNEMAHRGSKNFESSNDRRTVLVVGDSMTFGDEVGDDVGWPKLLSTLNPKLNIVNLAVSGYGVDQMYITLAEEISRYKPDLVIMAFISSDLSRSLLSFFAYSKPKFELRGESLVVTNSPVGSIESVVKKLRQKEQPFISLNSSALYRTAIGAYNYNANLFGQIPNRERLFAVNGRLVEEAARISKRNGAKFLLVNLPYEREHIYGFSVSTGDTFLNYVAETYGVSTLSLRKLFLDAKGISNGHYQAPGHRLAAVAILKALSE